MQRHMGRKELDRLVWKLRSMHLAVPGAVAHLYHIQHALSQGGGVPSLAGAEIKFLDYGLAGTSGAICSLSHTSGQDCLL